MTKTPEHRAQARSFMDSMVEVLNENNPDGGLEFVRIGNVVTQMPRDANPEEFAERYMRHFKVAFPYLATSVQQDERGEQ